MTTPVAYDCETYPIHMSGKSSNDMVPRLVCLSWADDEHPEGVLLSRMEAVWWWMEQLDSGRPFVGANLAFDLNVMLRAVQEEARADDYEACFHQVYDHKKLDVQVQARLEDISRGGMFMRGGYTLAQLEQRYAPEAVRTTEKKGINVWRLRYNELEGVPVADYPEDAANYALEDAVNTWAVYKALDGSRNSQATGLRTHYDWLLSLMSAWGLMVDQEWVAYLVEHYHQKRLQAREELVGYGLIRGPEDKKAGTKDTKAVRAMFEEAFLSIGETPMRTSGGKSGNTQVATNKAAMNALEDAGALTPAFVSYRLYNRSDKFISTYLQPLADAGELPLCPRFNVIVDSGRTSSSKPNVQNFPSRLSDAERSMLAQMLSDSDGEGLEDEVRMVQGFITGPDIRGAFVPRPGMVYVAADYSAIEMAGVAQCTRNLTGELGTLALAINKGLDLHCYVAAQIHGCSYEEFMELYKAGDKKAKQLREVSKIGNYGGWGGIQAKSFKSFARQQGVSIDTYTAELVLNTMARVWSEREPYFRAINKCKRPNGSYYVQQHGPDRITQGWRLRVTKKFTQAANTLFQGIVADGALWSMNLIMKDIYLDETSPLFGGRLLLFVHDEFVAEVEADKAEAAGARLSELMVAGMKRFLPDLLVEADPSTMEDRWAK